MDNKKKALIQILSQHKHAMSSAKKWDEYAKQNNLPPSVTLIYQFGTWNKVKEELGLPILKRQYSQQELEEIAFQYRDYFERKSVWDEFSKVNNLPTSGTYIKAFGSWKNLQKHLGIDTTRKKKSTYSKEKIISILKEHRQHYDNRKQWDEYARKHKLPTYKTIRNYLDYGEMMDVLNKTKNKDKYTSHELISIALKYKDIFLNASMTKWNEFAKENNLPSSFIYYKHFGTWNVAKKVVRDSIKSK